MSKFKDRLAEALKHLKLSNYRLATDLKISKSTVGNYLKGISSPNSANLDVITGYLEKRGINKNWLITGEGEMVSNYSMKTTIHDSNQTYITNKNGNIFKELPDGSYDVQVPIIPFSAYASYLESVETGTVNEDFETTVFKVDRVGRGNYKAFVVRGDSMDGGHIHDTEDGSTVLGRELGRHHWKDGFKPNKYGWIILCRQNIFHKDITGFDPETGNITCHSRNTSPEYADFELNLNEVYQIFKVIKRTF